MVGLQGVSEHGCIDGILLLPVATLVIRYGSARFPYDRSGNPM